MFGAMQLIAGLGIGCWGFVQIPESPENGCATLLVAGLLIVSAIGKLFEVPDAQKRFG
jgi:hypothetical protein